MISYEKFIEELVSRGIDRTIITKLIEEYKTAKREYFVGDHEKAVLHAAKFSELSLGLVKNTSTGKPTDIDNLRFDSLFEEIRKYPKPTPRK